MCGDLRLFFCIFLFFREDVEFQNGRLVTICLSKEGVGCKVLGMQFLLPAKTFQWATLDPFSRPVLASKPHV